MLNDKRLIDAIITGDIPATASTADRDRVRVLHAAYSAAMASRHRGKQLRTPELVHETIGPVISRHTVERMWCLALDARSRLIGEPIEVSRGDVDGTDAGPRAFFRAALQAGAVAAIAVHNHPTGDSDPSREDIEVTKRLTAAGRVVNVPVVDHVIIGDGYCSLRREYPEIFG